MLPPFPLPPPFPGAADGLTAEIPPEACAGATGLIEPGAAASPAARFEVDFATVTVAVAWVAPICAVTVALPGPTAVTFPVELTEATAALLVVQPAPDRI